MQQGIRTKKQKSYGKEPKEQHTNRVITIAKNSVNKYFNTRFTALYEIFVRNNLDQEIRNLRQTFLQIFEQNPNFWKAQESNRLFYDQLNHTVSEFIRNNPGYAIYGSLYDPIVKTSLEEEIKRLNQSQKEKTDLLKRLSQVEDRLEEFETPLGNIPIIFNEAIYVFPLAVSATFLTCALSYVGSVRTRKALHDLYYLADLQKVFRKIDTYIDKIAPLWLDLIIRININFSFFFYCSCHLLYLSYLQVLYFTVGS